MKQKKKVKKAVSISIHLSEAKKKIIRFLLNSAKAKSYPSAISRGLDINLTTVAANLKSLGELRISGRKLLIAEWERLPNDKIKRRNNAKFYKIIDVELARKILGE